MGARKRVKLVALLGGGLLLVAVVVVICARPGRVAYALQRARLWGPGVVAALRQDPSAVDARGMTALHWAVEVDEATVVMILLARGADANCQDNQGDTALHGAARRGDLGIATLLLEYGADPNARDREAMTPLHLAAWNGKTSVAALLLDHGADLEARCDLGSTPLGEAAWTGEADMVQLLLDRGAKKTLRTAALLGDTATAATLLAQGADVNARDGMGGTALYWAVRKGHMEMAKLLLAHGAKADTADDPVHSPRLGDFPANTALYYAADTDRADLAELLQRHGAPLTLEIAAMLGDDAGVARLLAQGANVDAHGNMDMTPLAWAAMKGHARAAKLLLERGADVRPTEKYWQRTALHWAAKGGHSDVVELLLAQGADSNATDHFRETPLALAADHPDTAALLREHGAHE